MTRSVHPLINFDSSQSADLASFPEPPQNHSETLVFSELIIGLFNPLSENRKQVGKPPVSRAKLGPHGPKLLSPHEQRRHIIDKFISKWRRDVGNDIYPALRLIIPDKDRDRGVYGLKESAIGKLLVKLMKIDKKSEDGYNLLHWKLPGQTTASRMAGDFAGRCFEMLSKRPMRMDYGNMRISEVNDLLDKLAASSGELENLEIFETFYERMNAEELLWLIRIVLKQMKVGATEKTFLDLWHPDAEALFNVSSSLRRVCWELHDPQKRLESEETGVTLMQCFQPQLAQFQVSATFEKMAGYLRPTEDDPEFWIEEKLDGERMQMHMKEDPEISGGKRFRFWSRKAKDYTPMYGEGFNDDQGALTRHISKAFADGVKNLILDGEMITWDPETDKMVGFGTLKTAANAEKKNYNNTGQRPLFRVFDILYLNDRPLTRYTLRDRHEALEKAVKGVHRRLEVHAYEAVKSYTAIEPMLRKVVAEASEGLVLKNPRSAYRLNSRNDDWLKVKPEYMSEFGEALDCVVIGGYYGSGHRGGNLSSFMCGLRASPNHIKGGALAEKCFSFFKVGGGFSAEDYAAIRHRTEGKWIEWDSKKPPTKYIELARGQAEKPDVWIRPSDSFVLEAKAASIGGSEQFALGITVRFPRLRKLRFDKAWDQGLSVQDFYDLKTKVEAETEEKTMEMEARRRRPAKRAKREIVIIGTDPKVAAAVKEEGVKTHLFGGLEFCVLTESPKPFRKTKAQLEAVIRENGGTVSQRAVPRSEMIIVADKNVVKVASLVKEGQSKGQGVDIVRPVWIRDCLAQGGEGGEPTLLPYEERHLLHATEELRQMAKGNTDKYGDAYSRAVTIDELGELLAVMSPREGGDSAAEELGEQGLVLEGLRGHIFQRCVVYVHDLAGDSLEAGRLRRYIAFGGGRVVQDLEDGGLTHVVVLGKTEDERKDATDEVRKKLGAVRPGPRVVSGRWVDECWKERTMLDEERFGDV
jgi:DNA ligase 4